MGAQPISTQALPPGTRVEEFVIERVLGSGGFGITYLATDTALGRQVVIKENLPAQFCFRDPSSLTVAPRHSSGEDVDNFQWSLENFSKESAMLASLDHPGIVRVHRSFQAFGTAYFVMPFVEGVTLDELAKQRDGGPFNEAELKRWLGRILEALGHLHDRGIYHRDIKPGNLLITDEGFPVLIDFGSARQRLSERSLTVVESAGYTPFEQLQTRGNVGPWSDLYALGATLVKVMTGETPPKTNDRTMGDPWQPLCGRQELQGRYSEVFLAGIDRALKLPIEERWQSAEEWNQALGGGKFPESVAPAVALQAAPKKANTKGRVPALLAMVAVLLLGLGLGGWWWLAGAGGISIFSTAVGGLVLTSEPSGARVFDGGGAELGVTPLELKSLPSGQVWEGRLELPDYEVAELREEVQEGEMRLASPVKLQPQPQKVAVTSEPAGAEVMEDGKVLGVTPWESEPRVVESKVALTLRLMGYEEEAVGGKVALGNTLQLEGKLRPQPQKVTVTSEPAGAEVLEDGKVLGVTPWESEPRVVESEVALTLRLMGYEEEALGGKVELGNTLQLEGKLRPQPQKVTVTSEPVGAQVMEGGKALGVTPLDLPEVLPETKVVYQLKLDGYEDAQVEGEVLVGKPLELAAVLEVLPARAFAGTKAGEEREFEIAPGVKITFCWCPAGEFVMGSPLSELGRDDDEKQVEVTLSKGFWLAKTEVTQGQWRAAGGIDVSGRPPAFWDGKVQYTWEQGSDQGVRVANFKGVNLPIERVDWNEARAWCLGMTKRLRNDGQLGGDWKVALPTEAQWEYACRAGTSRALHSGRNLTSKEGACGNLGEVGWYDKNSKNRTQPVGQKKANAWGLHDMHGNVLEWCADWYEEELGGGVDPQGAVTGVPRASRGGSWSSTASLCRAARRGRLLPDSRNPSLGFRPALVPSE